MATQITQTPQTQGGMEHVDHFQVGAYGTTGNQTNGMAPVGHGFGTSIQTNMGFQQNMYQNNMGQKNNMGPSIIRTPNNMLPNTTQQATHPAPAVHTQ